AGFPGGVEDAACLRRSARERQNRTLARNRSQRGTMENISRRQILTGAASAAMIVAPRTAFSYQANSKVVFGIIGTGGRGSYVGTHMANDANAKLGAICDIYPDKIDSAKTNIPGAADVKAYKDLNELLARPDIDAVLIATPVYLHPVHFEAAVKAGKHIY